MFKQAELSDIVSDHKLTVLSCRTCQDGVGEIAIYESDRMNLLEVFKGIENEGVSRRIGG